MKIAYSTFCEPVWKLFKMYAASADRAPDRETFKLWMEWFLEYRVKELALGENPSLERVSQAGVPLWWGQLTCLYLWKFCPLRHYFIAPGLSDFLVSAVRDFTPDFCRKLPCALFRPEEHPDVGERLVSIEEDDPTLAFFKPMADPKRLDSGVPGFALHFPAKERRRSIVVLPESCMADFYSHPPANRVWFFTASDGEDVCHMQLAQGDMGDADWICRLIFGFSLYIEAFPDVVVQSSPEEVNKIAHYAGPRLNVTSNDLVRNENRAAVSPHFRRGHFRVLQSERFTHKRGQLVFVKGCFIRGQAFDVLTEEKEVLA